MTQQKPGPDDSPLSDEDEVIRLGKVEVMQENEVSAQEFTFSSKERKSVFCKLSVWESSLTSPEQAIAILGPGYMTRVMILKVQSIKNACKINGSTVLDVRWDRLKNCIDNNNKIFDDSQPGCEGHSAIVGLDSGNKKQRKTLRRKLAKLAQLSKWYILDENQIDSITL